MRHPKFRKTSLAVAISLSFGVMPVWAGKATIPAFNVSDEMNWSSTRGRHLATNGAGVFINVWNDGNNIYARYSENGAVKGDAFLVASDFGGSQISVAMNSNGDAVVAWLGGNGVSIQRIPAGTTALSLSPVNAGSSNSGSVSVALDNGGDFAVAWSPYKYPNYAGAGTSAYLRTFNAVNSPTSSQTELTTTCGATNNQSYGYYYQPATLECSIDVSTDQEGTHAVAVWNADDGVIARRFNLADGNLQGSDTRVDNTPPNKGSLQGPGSKLLANTTKQATVAMDSDGDFSVGWTRESTNTELKQFCETRTVYDYYTYEPHKVKYCYTFPISETTNSIFMQRFDANNSPDKTDHSGKPTDTLVEKGTKNLQAKYPQISSNGHGDLAMAWEFSQLKKFKVCGYYGCYDETIPANSVRATRYQNKNGKLKKSPKITVATGNVSEDPVYNGFIKQQPQEAPSVAIDGTGNLQVLWSNSTRGYYQNTAVETAKLFPAK